jgi:hypothetical protein
VSERVHVPLLALLLASCDSRALVVGEGPAPSSLGGRDRSMAPRCQDEAAARVADDECWPTRHVGRWRGLVTGDARYRHVLAEPLEFTTGEVTLDVTEQGAGTLWFAPEQPWVMACAGDAGVPPALADAGVATPDGGAGLMDAGARGVGSPCAPPVTSSPGLAAPGLLLDYGYQLDGLSMSGGPELDRTEDPLVRFSLLIAAPWRETCGTEPVGIAASACVCSADGCGVAQGVLQVSLSLSRDARALRGTVVSSEDAGLVTGLELVRQ